MGEINFHIFISVENCALSSLQTVCHLKQVTETRISHYGCLATFCSQPQRHRNTSTLCMETYEC